MVTLEREKLAANKEAMNMIATALNNVANAFFKMADLLQQSQVSISHAKTVTTMGLHFEI